MATATLYRYRWLLIRLPILAATMAVAWLAWAWLYPMPASQITFSAGLKDGAYYPLARQYADALQRHGVSVVLLESEGSAQNLQRLKADAPEADVALVQGGFGWSSQSTQTATISAVQTLANVGIEAVWIFSRQREFNSLLQLRGLRVAVGPEGSGHRVMAQLLTRQQRIKPEEIRFSPLSGMGAAEALARDEVVAVVMVASADAPAVGKLLRTPGVHLAALQRTVAIAERNNFLEPRLLAQDSLGPGTPPRDVTLLTTHTHLVVRTTLDSALKRAMTAAAMQVQGSSGPFHRAGDFPALRRSDFPTAPEARNVMGHGLGWLERALPFWWAQVVERLVIVCVPLAVVAWWLSLLIPAWLRWKLESRVTRWYGELKFIENDLAKNNLSDLDMSRLNGRLARMDKSISTLTLPRELAQRWYTLHQHVDFVRHRIYSLRGR